MNLTEHGAAHLSGAAAPFLSRLDAIADALGASRPGVRLYGTDGLAELLAPHALGALAPGKRPVRAILFDKSKAANWALGWHQDRTIAVKERAEVPGFGPWSVKAGIAHVEPPFALIERMTTIRFHLDPVNRDNAPLLVALGSHRLGKIAECDIDQAIARCDIAHCLADRGDAWIYATPILHASAPAMEPRGRRVLQVDFSADTLPEPLDWAGI